MTDTSDGGDDAPSSFSSGNPASDGYSIDTLFEAIADRRSRYVLAHLESVSVSVVELDDLVDSVAEHEVEEGLASNSEDHCERVAVALHHNYLPKLDDAAVIDYDSRTKTVKYWGDDRVTACLELYESKKKS